MLAQKTFWFNWFNKEINKRISTVTSLALDSETFPSHKYSRFPILYLFWADKLFSHNAPVLLAAPPAGQRKVVGEVDEASSLSRCETARGSRFPQREHLFFFSDSVSGAMTFPMIKNIVRHRTNQIAVMEVAADRVQTRRLHDVHLWSHCRRLSPTLVKNSEEDWVCGTSGGVWGSAQWRAEGCGSSTWSEAAGDFCRVSTWGRHEKVEF